MLSTIFAQYIHYVIYMYVYFGSLTVRLPSGIHKIRVQPNEREGTSMNCVIFKRFLTVFSSSLFRKLNLILSGWSTFDIQEAESAKYK